jgi:hypothetical protein
MLNVEIGVDTTSNYPTMKTWLISILLSVLAAISPMVPLFVTATLLIISDMVFAIYRAYRNGVPITSRKLSQVLPKLILYNIGILLAFLVEKYVLVDTIPISKLALGVISMVEMKSIDESFQSIFGYSLYAKLLAMIKRPEQNPNK